MEIKGLDYNTKRQALMMPEYGREIQKMIDHAVQLTSRQERLRCAKTIVKLMATKVPQTRDNNDYQQTLWDHLYLISGKRLDIDWPYDVSQAEKINSSPEPLALPQSKIALRHYGKLIEEMCDKLKTMPAGSERDQLVRLVANQMKRDLVQWGHGSMDDEKVADDLALMTDGQIRIDLQHFKFERVVVEEEPKRNGKKKK